MNPFSSFTFLCPVCLIVATFVGSLGFPAKSYSTVETKSPTDHVIVGMLSGISPLSYPLSASVQFAGPSSALSGSLNVTCTLQSLSVLNASVGVPSTLLLADAELMLFRPIAVTFDSCHLALFFRSSVGVTGAQLRWSFVNPLWSMVISVLRLLFLTLLLPYLLYFVVQAICSPDQALQRWLTALMTVATILFLDPIYVTQFFAPSAARQICHFAFRDVYFGYLAFYLLALFLPEGANLTIPVIVLVFLSSALFAHDFFMADTREGILPRPVPPDALSTAHLLVVGLLEVMLLVRAVVSTAPEGSARRYTHYNIVAIPFVALLILLAACDVFTDLFLNGRELLAMSVVTAFALIMEYFHSDIDDSWYGEAIRNGDDSQLGVDEDSGAIGEVVTMEPAQSDL